MIRHDAEPDIELPVLDCLKRLTDRVRKECEFAAGRCDDELVVDQCSAKLRDLERVGVDQFNIYLMTHSQEETLSAYGKEIIPQFAGVTA